LTYRRNQVIDQADLILMIDVDVPWCRPRFACGGRAAVPHRHGSTKDRLGYWHFPRSAAYQAGTV